MKQISITPVILIGGKGKRLGHDKLFLRVNGTPVISRTFNVLKDVFHRAPLFVGREGLPYPYLGVRDAIKGIGPKGGLLTAFMHTDTDYVFVVACDMPFISTKLLEFMLETLKEESEIYIPLLKNGYIEPLFAFYKRTLFKKLKEQIETGDYRMRSLLNGANVQFLTEKEIERFDSELTTFFNINTKSDLIRAEVEDHEKN